MARRGSKTDHDLIVVGAGAAGLGAVRAARWAGADVALLTDSRPGGDCTFTGCVPSKTLLAAARDGLGFTEAAARVRATVERIAATESVEVLRAGGTTVIEGRARLVTHDTVAVDDRRITAPRIIVATGSRPAMPDIDGLAEADPLTTETVFDLAEPPRSLGIIGGGPTGCELAQAFAAFGVEVTVFEAGPQLLGCDEPDAAAIVRAALQDAGVSVHHPAQIESVEPASRTQPTESAQHAAPPDQAEPTKATDPADSAEPALNNGVNTGPGSGPVLSHAGSVTVDFDDSANAPPDIHGQAAQGAGSRAAQGDDSQASQGVNSRAGQGAGSRAAQGTDSQASRDAGSQAAQGTDSQASQGVNSRAGQGAGSRAAQGAGSRAAQGTDSQASQGVNSQAGQGDDSRAGQGAGSRAAQGDDSQAGRDAGSQAGQDDDSQAGQGIGGYSGGHRVCWRSRQSGGELRSVLVERVLVAAGRRPTSDGLGLRELRVKLTPQGHVITDDRLATSVRGVYAAGDVAAWPPLPLCGESRARPATGMSTDHTSLDGRGEVAGGRTRPAAGMPAGGPRSMLSHAADEMGRIAAANALGRGPRGRFRGSMVPRVVFTDPEVASVGVLPRHAPTGSRVACLPLTELDRAVIDGRTDGFIAIVAGPRPVLRNIAGGRILGAVIVAPRAGEMIAEIVLAMRTGAFTGRLAQASHAYPTWSSGVQKAAAQFFGEIEGRRAHRID